MIDITNETTTDMATKTSVGVGGAVYAWLDMPLSSWVALATLVYMVCQLIVILPKVFTVIQLLFKRQQ